MLRKIYLLLLLLSCSIAKLSAQELYDSLLYELNSKYPQEKIYIHTDKTYYNPGETVWFKAYVKSDNFSTAISTNLYAELIDEKNNVLSKKIMPIILSGAGSQFELPDSVKKSKLYIRAYTRWMLNFDSTLIYTKAININQPNLKKAPAAPVYTLNFFPEGGDLVAGIESKVAFKTNDAEGLPFDIKGDIIGEDGAKITSFKTTHDGMGYFLLKPEARKRYKAVWKDASGAPHETLVPNAKVQSATLSLEQRNGEVFFTIRRPADATDPFKEFVIIGQMHQQIVYAARINFKVKTEVTAPIPVDTLKDGILQVTLFNAAEQPVAERIAFINNTMDQFITDVHMIEKKIQPKAKNVLQLDLSGELKSNLSVSITDDIQSPGLAYGENILSQLLMTTDLKGYVHNPGYYFSSDADSVKNHLDLVMMTNGWRRFKWEDILADKWPQIRYVPDNYLSVEGNVYGLSPNDLNGKMITGFLQTNNLESKSLLTFSTNKDGSFMADKLYFFDTAKIYYQINNDKDKKLTNRATFAFRNGFVKPPVVAKPSFLIFAPPMPVSLANTSVKNFQQQQDFEQQSKIKVLQNVTVTGKVKSPEDKLNEQYASGLFNSGFARTFAVENDPLASAYRSVFDYLLGKVAGLQINVSGMDATVSRRGSATSLFLNEMQADADLLMSTSMSDVAMIKVFDPPFMGAVGGGAGGAVAVYTKKGASANKNVQGLNVAVIQGYSTYKEFYAPDYEKTADSNPDYRTTLYWNPFVLFDGKNKRATIPFFNNSTSKRIRVIIEGINEKGELTREEKIFE
ncbi:MAG: hypothetical protein QM687_14110 [Ferruginibacter sp.]